MIMTKTNTKRALLMSGLALLLCVSMLVGSTYAWFTDSVTSGNNIIKSGNLDVELQYKKVVNGTLTDWADVAGEDELFAKDALWEPGHAEVVYLKVSNVGTLDLKYQLGVNIIKEIGSTNVYDEEFKLSDYLVFKVLTSDTEFDYADYDTREEVVAETAGIARGLTDYNGTTTALADKEVDYLALIVYMPTDVDNRANYKEGFDAPYIELGVNLYATQYTAETDSFGPDYDKDAWADGMKVYDANDLKAALNNGGTYNLENDIDLSNESLVVVDDTALNLNGNELSAQYLTSEGDLSIANGTLTLPEEGYVYTEEDSNITLENVVIDSDSLSVMAYAGGTVTLKNVIVKNTTTSNPIQNYGGNLILENVTVAQEGDANTAWYSSAVQVVNQIVKNAEANKWETVSQANTTINGGSYVGKKAIMISAPGGNVTINGGDFEGSEFVIQDDFAPQNYLNGNNYESVITINGGTFNGKIKVSAATELVINGGTFTDSSVENYVADGFVVVDNGDGTYSVLPDGLSTVAGYSHLYTDGTNYYAYDATGLISMRNFWKANWCGNNMWGRSYNVMADIDATGYTWDNVWVNVGSNENDGFVFDGHGNTITGLTINGGLFGGTPNGGNKPNNPGYVKNITFDGVKVVGDHFVGVVWSDAWNELVVENVTVINSNIAGKCNVAALVGGTASEGGDATVKFINCVVKNNVITAEGKINQDPNGAAAFLSRAYANTSVVFEGTNVSEDNVMTNNNGLVGGGIYGYTTWANGGFVGTGICDTFTNWKGTTALAEGESLAEALKESSNVVLPEGDFSITDTAGKTAIISGTEDTVITVPTSPNMGSANLTFNGVTVKTPNGGFNTGIQHIDTVTYNNATIVGSHCLYGNKEVYNNCTFDLTATADYLWIYGANNTEFINCTFNTLGKAILVYNEGDGDCKITVKGCTFNATQGAKAGDIKNQNCAAIEIYNYSNSGVGQNHTLITEGNVIDSDFSGEWRIKNFMNGGVVTVNGVEYTQIALDGKLMTIDANKNVTVQ